MIRALTLQLTRRVARVLALIGCGCFLVACEAVPTGESVVNKELVGKVTAGIRPVENRLDAEQPLEVLFYLSNGTDTSVEVLPWGTPLEQDLTADVFVVSKEGDAMPYGGRIVKRPPPGPDDYLTLAAGEKRETVVNLSDAYESSASGEYTVVLKTRSFLGKADNTIDPVVVEDTVIVSRQ